MHLREMNCLPIKINYIDTNIFSVVVFASRLNYIMNCLAAGCSQLEAYLELVLATRRFKVALVEPKIGVIRSFSQNYDQLSEVPLVEVTRGTPSAP